ncbi:MAG: LPS assembly lipoprotein LptE [Rhizomicrobium sp.]
MFRIIFAAAFLVLLSSCAPESGAMTAGPGQPAAGSPLANAIAVGAVVGGASNNSFVYADVSNEDLRAALQQSLEGRGLFTPADARYALSLTLAMERETTGTNSTVHVRIRYTLVEYKSGRTLVDETLDTTSDVALSASAGLPYKSAQEDAIKRNITQMMDKLDRWGG